MIQENPSLYNGRSSRPHQDAVPPSHSHFAVPLRSASSLSKLAAVAASRCSILGAVLLKNATTSAQEGKKFRIFPKHCRNLQKKSILRYGGFCMSDTRINKERQLTPEEKWEQATIANNFIFYKVMRHNPDVCKNCLKYFWKSKLSTSRCGVKK